MRDNEGASLIGDHTRVVGPGAAAGGSCPCRPLADPCSLCSDWQSAWCCRSSQFATSGTHEPFFFPGVLIHGRSLLLIEIDVLPNGLGLLGQLRAEILLLLQLVDELDLEQTVTTMQKTTALKRYLLVGQVDNLRLQHVHQVLQSVAILLEPCDCDCDDG